MNTKRLTTCDNIIEANIIKGKLNDAGIYAFISNENMNSLIPSYQLIEDGRIGVIIDKNDWEEANQIIFENPSLDLNEDLDKIHCPQCGSLKIRYSIKKNITYFFSQILSILFAINYDKIKPNYICKNCGAEFSE